MAAASFIGASSLNSSHNLLVGRSSCRQATNRITCQSHASEDIPELQISSPGGISTACPSFNTKMPVSSDFGDWRSFRAALVQNMSTNEQYAHEIPIVEPGCVLLATQSLERHPLLRNSVILILEVTDGSVRGIILNKRMPFTLEDEDVDSSDTEAVSLSNLGCRSFVSGNPAMLLHSKPKVHTLSSNKGLRGYKTVMNGLYLGDKDTFGSTVESLERGYAEAEQLRIYVGDIEWETSQLTAEIRAFNWWKVVSCSSNVLQDVPVSSLWNRLHDLCHKV